MSLPAGPEEESRSNSSIPHLRGVAKTGYSAYYAPPFCRRAAVCPIASSRFLATRTTNILAKDDPPIGGCLEPLLTDNNRQFRPGHEGVACTRKERGI